MAREAFAQLQIPSKGAESIPYPDWRQIIQGVLGHNVEAFAAEVVGAGGAGGQFVCPFEPAVLLISEATAPLLQLMLPGSAGQVDINAITGAAAAAAPVITPVDAEDKTQGYTVDLPTGIAPDGDTASVVALGFRDTNGSL